jgi:hypothetical protein
VAGRLGLRGLSIRDLGRRHVCEPQSVHWKVVWW